MIQKIVQTADYKDYYQQRTKLEAERDEVEARFRAARQKRDRDAIRQIQRQQRDNATAVARLEMTHPGAPVRAMNIEDSPRPKNSPVFIRGEAENKGEIVPRRSLEVLAGPNRPAFTNGSGRLELAHSIVDKQNPLTPRVMINRVWQHHFGEGFVPTPDDLGTMSEPPSHPELLDYLAARFRDEGWSLKQMHRLIMLSAVYQQTTDDNPRYAQVDPNNRLLWRANIRRLEFEVLRDSLLAIGGSLDTTMYGRPIDLERNPESRRRTIYGLVNRSDVLDVLVNFDFASPDMPSGKRYETTVPQQALFLMNSPVVVEQAKRLVYLKEFKDCESDPARVQFLYERIYQRPARPEEIKLALAFIADAPAPEKSVSSEPAIQAISNPPRPVPKPGKQQQRMEKNRPAQSPKRAPLTAWQEYAHALLQANEASFVN